MKIEKDISEELQANQKEDEIKNGLCTRLRPLVGLPVKLYGLAKVYINRTPLRPVAHSTNSINVGKANLKK